MLVELVEHDLGDGVAAALDDQPGAFLVGLVGDVDDAGQAALADQVADADEQAVAGDLVGELGHDQALAAAVVLLDADLGPDPDRAAPGQQGVADPGGAHDRGAGGEVGALDPAEQVLAGQLRVVDQGDGGVDDLAQVVGRDLGRHADGDALRPVGQQVGEPGGQDHRLLALVVVVRREVDGVLVDVAQQLHGQGVQPGLGVPHGRRLVPVGGAEVALAVDQGIAGGEVLPEADHGVVDGGVAVGVVLAQHRADDVGGLAAAVRGPHPLLVRAPEDAPVDRLEPVPDVRQRPGHDHAHRVVEERALHLLSRCSIRLASDVRSGRQARSVYRLLRVKRSRPCACAMLRCRSRYPDRRPWRCAG